MLCIVICLTFVLFGCNKQKQNASPKALENCSIQYDEEFGGMYVKITIDDFNALGYAFGDSLLVKFSNGYTLDDLPYYNGYYVGIDEPLLVGYPGYPYIKLGLNNGPDLWEIAGVDENTTATITLKEKGKYLNVQEAMDIHYTDVQGDIPDEVFANFRNVQVGNLKEGVFFRGASPVDNQHNRAPIASGLLEDAGVNFDVDLSDNDDKMAAHVEKIRAGQYDSQYFLSLYDADNVIWLAMNMNFKSGNYSDTDDMLLLLQTEGFAQKLARGLEAMATHEGPYYVHCVEGKDRTGYFCMVIEALAGATYQEIVDDYMLTYDNYYGINLQSDPSKYAVIKEKNIDVFLSWLVSFDKTEPQNIKTADLEKCAEKYLKAIGMSEESIGLLKRNLVG